MTRDEVKLLLATSALAVERAMVALYHCQTATEQSTARTVEHNGRGFNALDASFGSSLAKQVVGGRKLSPRQIQCGRKMAIKYAGQLTRMTNEDSLELFQASKVYATWVNDDNKMSHLIFRHDPFQRYHGEHWTARHIGGCLSSP